MLPRNLIRGVRIDCECEIVQGSAAIALGVLAGHTGLSGGENSYEYRIWVMASYEATSSLK